MKFCPILFIPENSEGYYEETTSKVASKKAKSSLAFALGDIETLS
jgi:hypothetical protein